MFARVLVFSLGATLVLTSCSPVAAPTDLPKATATYTALSPAEAKAQFETIANASCDKAMAEGVVEQSIASGGFTLVMVPKEEGYKDFSAAYFEPADNYELIWEADALSACSASISFSLAAEAGVESEIKVTFDGRDSTFETFEDLGEFGTSRLRYNVDNGLLSRIEVLDATSIDARMIRYGNLQDADWNILRTAVDRYLEDK
jgi:FPC/CPF motif-containing protein YcgG